MQRLNRRCLLSVAVGRLGLSTLVRPAVRVTWWHFPTASTLVGSYSICWLDTSSINNDICYRSTQAVVYVRGPCRSGAVAVWCVQRRMAPDVFSFHSATPWRWLRAAPSSGDEAVVSLLHLLLCLAYLHLRKEFQKMQRQCRGILRRFSFTFGLIKAWFIMGHHKSAESKAVIAAIACNCIFILFIGLCA